MNQNLKEQVLSHLNTINNQPNPNESVTENFLMVECLKHPNYISTLMNISMDSGLSNESRLKGVIVLKRIVSSKFLQVDYTQFEYFKKNALQHLCSCNDIKVGGIFSEVLYTMILKEYPKKWTVIEDEIRHVINNVTSIDMTYWTLVAYLKMVKVREFACEKVEMQLKEESIAAVFPKLEEFLTGMLSSEMNKQNAMILHLICKIFTKSTRYSLPNYFYNADKVQFWMESIIRILQLPYVNPSYRDEILKCRKWVTLALVMFFNKHSKVSDEPKINEFNQLFVSRYATDIISHLINEIKKFDRNVSESGENRIATNMMRCFMHTSRKPLLKSITETQLHSLAEEYVLGSLMFNQVDKDCYEDDPIEYFKRNDDFLINITYRAAAINFLFTLYNEYLDRFVQIFTSQFENSATSEEQKEVLYLLLEKLFEKISDEERLIPFVNTVFINILPKDLASSKGFLLMRCCRVIFRHVNSNVNTESLKSVYEQICVYMKHEELPVRCSAALALNSILLRKEMAQLLKPHLKDVLMIMLNLIQEIENDSLMNSLKSIFVIFKDDITPYISDLVKTITTICLSIDKKNREKGNEGDYEEFAFLSGLSSIEYLLELSADRATHESIAESIWPLIQVILLDFDLESFEDAINLTSILITKLKNPIHPSSVYVVEYFIYGLGNINLIQDKLAHKFQFNNPLLNSLGQKNPEMFMEFSSAISTVLRNMIYHHWEFLKTSTDQLGNNYLELLFTCINSSLNIETDILDATNKTCLLMLQSTLVLTAKQYNPEMVTNSTLLTSSIQNCLNIINNKKGNTDEESSFKTFENCLMHNIGIALICEPLKTLEYLEKTNMINLIFTNLESKFQGLLTQRVQKAFFMGVLSLLNIRTQITNPVIMGAFSSPSFWVIFNRQFIKLYIFSEVAKEGEAEIDNDDIYNDSGLDDALVGIMSKLEDDPSLDGITKEFNENTFLNQLEIEVLYSFDYDTCDEFFGELNEFKAFSEFLAKEKGSDLFQLYLQNTSPAMQKNVQVAMV